MSAKLAHSLEFHPKYSIRHIQSKKHFILFDSYTNKFDNKLTHHITLQL